MPAASKCRSTRARWSPPTASIAKALVGNPGIADVLPISERSVYVLGKAFGTTSLTLYDRTNRVIAVMDVQVGPDVEGIRSQLSQLIPGQQIEARLSNGSVVLTGLASNVGAADRAFQIAKAYAGDKVINMVSMGASQQVMLEVRFAEVRREIGEKLAMRHFGASRDGTFGRAIGEGASFDSTNGLRVSGVTDAFGIATKAFSLGGLDISSTLDMLERRGLSKTLAEPTLVAISGEKASFLAGGEFPIPVAQSGSGGTGGNAITVEFKPFGVSLGFTPTVLGDKVISLIVEPEVSSIDPTASISIGGLTIPGLQTRRASTTVELRDGESFAIAGLMRSDYPDHRAPAAAARLDPDPGRAVPFVELPEGRDRAADRGDAAAGRAAQGQTRCACRPTGSTIPTPSTCCCRAKAIAPRRCPSSLRRRRSGSGSGPCGFGSGTAAGRWHSQPLRQRPWRRPPPRHPRNRQRTAAMNIDRLRWTALAALPLLGACATDLASSGPPASTFGEANRQTMLAQVVDPDPQYEFLDPETSAEHAAKAIERYRKDAVKKPERVKSTSGVGGGGGGGS